MLSHAYLCFLFKLKLHDCSLQINLEVTAIFYLCLFLMWSNWINLYPLVFNDSLWSWCFRMGCQAVGHQYMSSGFDPEIFMNSTSLSQPVNAPHQGYAIIYYIAIFFSFMYISMFFLCGCMYIMHAYGASEAGRAYRTPWNWSFVCELLCGCWGMHPGPL